jgi:hypothetical protein
MSEHSPSAHKFDSFMSDVLLSGDLGQSTAGDTGCNVHLEKIPERCCEAHSGHGQSWEVTSGVNSCVSRSVV